MTQETIPEIPDEIANLMRDDEIENMRNLDGWAVGTVVVVDEDGVEHDRIESAWIELFNGEGRAGRFGGVRFMAIDEQGRFREAYAYPSRNALDGNEPGWYVRSFDRPEHPYVGPIYPDGPEVSR